MTHPKEPSESVATRGAKRTVAAAAFESPTPTAKTRTRRSAESSEITATLTEIPPTGAEPLPGETPDAPVEASRKRQRLNGTEKVANDIESNGNGVAYANGGAKGKRTSRSPQGKEKAVPAAGREVPEAMETEENLAASTRTKRAAANKANIQNGHGKEEEDEDEDEDEGDEKEKKKTSVGGKTKTKRRSKGQQEDEADYDGHEDPEEEAEEDEGEDQEIVANFTQLLQETPKRGSFPSEPLEAGVIEEVELVNFMCHKYFKVSLQPNLNFLTGPNGSGKSAILTAISVCLGGKATSTNRASSLKSFVKTGEK